MIIIMFLLKITYYYYKHSIDDYITEKSAALMFIAFNIADSYSNLIIFCNNYSGYTSRSSVILQRTSL